MKILSPMTEAQDAVSKEYVDGLLGSGGGGGEAEGDYATKEELANLKAEVIDNEEVAAAALNDLRTSHLSLKDKVHFDYATKEEATGIQAALLKAMTDNEEVAAAALNALEARLIFLENIQQ